MFTAPPNDLFVIKTTHLTVPKCVTCIYEGDAGAGFESWTPSFQDP